MDDERIDLSALDPARDGKRWDEMVDSVAARALAARRRSTGGASPGPVALQLVAWARPALALAAALALVVWAAALAAGGAARASAPGTTRTEPAFALSAWAMQDELPSTEDVLETLGGDHADP
jgi:hypothetical protein